MEIEGFIRSLGYHGNPNYITGEALRSAGDYAHVFRRGVERVGLRGVYALRQPAPEKSKMQSLIPTVYVCAAKDEENAREFQKLAWNQNVAPFVLIHTPTRIRLYSGFAYAGSISDAASKKNKASTLALSVEFDQIATVLAAFDARHIDDGLLWQEFGRHVDPKKRVDWDLLENLRALDARLIAEGLDWKVSHALIGKYVYLKYLRQRDILSDRRLAEAGVQHDQIFTREATKGALTKLLNFLEHDWMNGAVYPIEWTRDTAPRQEHVRLVAAIFNGDVVQGQMYLPFDRYDFSVIPVETISSIYEFFLHANDPNTTKRSAKKLGAYYTPVPLVNFMLDELERHAPLDEKTTCFDGSCGSGAFLVQCYRRMIERRVRADGEEYRKPSELRDLLIGRVFGVDRDGDACRVTELSLILTLLDYVKPPDLAPVHNFKLPNLHDKNIFETDFFKPNSAFVDFAKDRRFNWVVGNPPWVELKPAKGPDDDVDARMWMSNNKDKMPIGGNQLAEAFLWKITDHLSEEGGAAILVPAMTLFKDESRLFRKQFFGCVDVWAVANFANMAEVLFAGRSRVPAAVLFYSVAPSDRLSDERLITTYSPLVANQYANRPSSPRRQKDTWSITITDSEAREISAEAVQSGDRLLWKLAMWGSNLDLRLFQRIARQFQSLGDICKQREIRVRMGMQLRNVDDLISADAEGKKGSIEFCPELVGKLSLDMQSIRKDERIYAFPQGALRTIDSSGAYFRRRGGSAGLEVSRPPHVIVNESRRFAVYSDHFIAVPHGQIGLRADHVTSNLLKAVSLFLSSDFAVYHQFFDSPSWGVHVSRADLDTLIDLPFPIERIEQGGLQEWSNLHAAIVKAFNARMREANVPGPSFNQESIPGELERLETEVNERVAIAFALKQSERWLIDDLVHVRMRLIQGKVEPVATREPVNSDIETYAKVLKSELDSFIKAATGERHTVDVLHHTSGAMIVISRGAPASAEEAVRVHRADADTARPLMVIRERLLKKHSQWVYFNRALRVYKSDATYVFKPMQYFHWLRSQALVDASEIIADWVSAGDPQG
jgi:hypothetical protein